MFWSFPIIPILSPTEKQIPEGIAKSGLSGPISHKPFKTHLFLSLEACVQLITKNKNKNGVLRLLILVKVFSINKINPLFFDEKVQNIPKCILIFVSESSYTTKSVVRPSTCIHLEPINRSTSGVGCYGREKKININITS